MCLTAGTFGEASGTLSRVSVVRGSIFLVVKKENRKKRLSYDVNTFYFIFKNFQIELLDFINGCVLMTNSFWFSLLLALPKSLSSLFKETSLSLSLPLSVYLSQLDMWGCSYLVSRSASSWEISSEFVACGTFLRLIYLSYSSNFRCYFSVFIFDVCSFFLVLIQFLVRI